jgi:hypothetical protein
MATEFTSGGIIFLVVSIIVLLFQTKQKYNTYKKEFHGKTGGPKYPSNQNIIIPTILLE